MDEFEITDETISLVPESQLVKELQDFEKRLDMMISQKKRYMKHMLAHTTNTLFPLRIFVSHSVDDETGAVTLHVQGGLLDENGVIIESARPFTSFLRRAFFEFEKSSEIEPIEWNRSQGFKDIDGFSVTRKIKQDVSVKIILLLKEDPPRYYPSKNLANLLSIDSNQSYALNSILYAIWDYVKNNGLQDSVDKKIINCDEKLAELLGVTKMSFNDIPNRVKPHLIPHENIELEYVIRLSEESKTNDVIYDIDVEVEEPSQSEIGSFLQDEPSKEINELNQKIFEAVQKINDHKKRREHFSQYSEDPVGFIDRVIFSQSRDLLLSNPQLKEKEQMRYSSFYEDSWVDESIKRYLEKRDQVTQGSQQNTFQ